MEICRANSRADIDAIVYGEFLKEFSDVAAEALAWAFHEHRRRSLWFPAISEIHQLLGERSAADREWAEVSTRRREAADIQQARKEGKLVEFDQIVKALKETAKRMPEPQVSQRVRHLRQREVSIAVPAVQLTVEQIEARREAERAEIERYAER